MKRFIDGYFGVTSSGSSMKTEILAGVTTFMTMSYIIFVNPSIIAKSGMPFDAVMVATCLSAALATIMMGVYANYPIGLAPSMGINAFFTFSLVMGMGFSWQIGITAIFIEGILFILLTFLSIRTLILNAIPLCLKIGIPAGIGLFLAFIGLQSGKIVVNSEATLVTVGSLRDPNAILTVIGFIIMVTLYVKRIKGSILIGILFVTLLAVVIGIAPMPKGIVSAPPSISPIFFKMDFSALLNVDFIIVVFVLLFMDIFNTAGTLIGVANRTGLLDKEGNLLRSKEAFMADAVGTAGGAVLGVTTVTAYVESVTGVEEGGRTGMTAVVTGVLFLLAMFFYPIVAVVPACATAPALIFVGLAMMSMFRELDFSDWTEAVPAAVTVMAMPFTYNIATGIEFGIITYVVIKVCAGRFKDISLIMYILAALFIAKEIFVKF